MRLDKYLTNKYPNLSRAYIKGQIKLGNFLIGDKQVKSSYILREGDKVALAPGFSLPDAGRILPNPNIKLNIIYEDNDVIVINKPARLSVHPRQDKNGLPLLSETDSTLVSGLLAYYPAIAAVGDSLALRPGLVHRLDKDTSGVMIIAKNQTSFDWLKKQFANRLVSKKYIALVHGRLKEKRGEIKTLLARATENPTKQKVEPWTQNSRSFYPSEDSQIQGQGEIPHRRPLTPRNQIWPAGAGITIKKGKEAVTQYKVIREFKDYSLIEARPKTGRLHQIRVHLAHLGHPVAGDAKYGVKRLPSPPGLIRQFLHAQELKIALPNGQNKTLNAPLPAELESVLSTLAGK